MKWLAYGQRMERWQARNRGERPKPLTPKLALPREHPILTELERALGILSDSSVHLTPEYFGSQHWIQNDANMELRYFTSDQRTIESSLITLIGIHGGILRIFDECLEGPFFSDDQWKQIYQEVESIGRPLAETFKATEEFDEI